MQKISSYLLKNRIQLVADLAAFSTEWTIVYQRQVKLYKGIDNTLEFDIKNADQKRIDLTTLSDIMLNIMDHSGYALPNSPYTLDATDLTGIAATTIPAADLADLEDQFLTFSVTATKNSADVLLYADTRFSSSGTIELLSNVIPATKLPDTYDDFYGLGDYNNTSITYSSSAIPLKFRSATPPTYVNLKIYPKDFVGSIWVEATKDTVVGNESFTYKGTRLFEQSYAGITNDLIELDPISIIDGTTDTRYTYLRVNYTKTIGGGAIFRVTRLNQEYSVEIIKPGIHYTIGSIIRIPGIKLDGVNNINDLLITITGIDTTSNIKSGISSVSIEGVAVNGTGIYSVADDQKMTNGSINHFTVEFSTQL